MITTRSRSFIDFKPLVKHVGVPMIISIVGVITCSFPVEAQELFEFRPNSQSTGDAKRQADHSRLSTLPTLTMLAQYRGEEGRGVQYLDEIERAKYLVHYCGQLLCDEHGLPLNSKVSAPYQRVKVFPKLQEGIKNTQVGLAIYVMDESGRIWISFEAEKNVLHHSSLLSGASVSAAGEMIIFEGRLYGINNYSGHYQPPPIVIERTLKVLRSHGISTTGLFVSRHGSDF